MQYSGRPLVAILALTGLVAGCGGGGGGDSQGSFEAAGSALAARIAAEGFWSGRTQSDGWADFIILEDGSTWGVFADATALTGAARGTSAIESGRFTSTFAEYSFASDSVPQVTYTGTGAPRSRIDAQGPGGRSLVLDYDRGYDTAASTQALAGRYELDQNTVLVISENGAFNWTASADCVLTGQATPRATGRNVFDLALTYVGTQCIHGDGTRIGGVAYLDSQASPPRLVALALRDNGAIGFISRANRFVTPTADAPAPGAAPTAAPAPAPAPATAPAPTFLPVPAPAPDNVGPLRKPPRDKDDDDKKEDD